jgi:hypothetical protein
MSESSTVRFSSSAVKYHNNERGSSISRRWEFDYLNLLQDISNSQIVCSSKWYWRTDRTHLLLTIDSPKGKIFPFLPKFESSHLIVSSWAQNFEQYTVTLESRTFSPCNLVLLRNHWGEAFAKFQRWLLIIVTCHKNLFLLRNVA